MLNNYVRHKTAPLFTIVITMQYYDSPIYDLQPRSPMQILNSFFVDRQMPHSMYACKSKKKQKNNNDNKHKPESLVNILTDSVFCEHWL